MNRGFSKKNWFNRLVSMVLTVALMITTIGVVSVSNSSKVSAATAVTSMDYYNSEEGPTIKRTGTGAVSFGFVLPKFNGKEPKELNYDNVRDDIQLYVKQENGTSGEWKKIEEVKSFVWNETWGIEHQLSWDGWVCWLKVSETTEFRFHSKSSGVNLDYT